MYRAHCAVIFAIAQLSCLVCFGHVRSARNADRDAHRASGRHRPITMSTDTVGPMSSPTSCIAVFGLCIVSCNLINDVTVAMALSAD